MRLIRGTLFMKCTTTETLKIWFKGWTENPVPVMGETLEELRWTLERMLESLDKPVIDNTDEDKSL